MKSIIITFVKIVLKLFPEKFREYYQMLVIYWVNKLNFFKRKEFYKEIENRKGLSIFDFKKLSQELSSFSEEYYYVNSRFAIANNLKKYSGWSKPIKGVIEHGVFKNTYINDFETNKNKFPAIFTFGIVRKKFMENLVSDTKVVHKIGPHIAYVDSLMDSNEIKEIKNELGKVLMAIPSHSIESHEIEFDYEDWINEIKKRSANYDTVIVNLFYMDILFDKYQPYIDAGFKIVTAGHRSDLNFLPRLKSILSLADMTMSNRFTTPLGYCLHLNIPHYIYQQSLDFKMTNQANESHRDTKADLEKGDIDYFTKFEERITKDQWKVYNDIWGGDSLKSKKELYEIFEELERKSLLFNN